MGDRSYLFDFEPGGFVDVCRDTTGARVELFEITGIRDRDAGEVLRSLRAELAARFSVRPDYRRIVVWTNAAWLATHDAEEYAAVRAWLDTGLRTMQHGWELPMVGQVGCAVLEGPLPDGVAHLRIGDPWDYDYEAERQPERRAQPRF
jgi:hypothetical protein